MRKNLGSKSSLLTLATVPGKSTRAKAVDIGKKEKEKNELRRQQERRGRIKEKKRCDFGKRRDGEVRKEENQSSAIGRRRCRINRRLGHQTPKG